MDSNVLEGVEKVTEENKEQYLRGAKRYVKRPVSIRAVQLRETVAIQTREGLLLGFPGDYLAEGPFGEIYPINREIFEKTYVEVEDAKEEG